MACWGLGGARLRCDVVSGPLATVAHIRIYATKTLGVPSAASIRSGVIQFSSSAGHETVNSSLSSRRRGAEGWPTGGAVLLPAPPIGQPSDRSIGAQSRFRSEKAAGAAADPSRDASSFLCSPMRREATRQCSARHSRRRLRWARVGRSGGTLFARHLPAPRRQPRAAADGGAVGAAAAAPPVGGALVVAWAALRRRSARPGSGGSLRRHGFERGCRASSGAGWLRAGLRSQLFWARRLFGALHVSCPVGVRWVTAPRL